MELVIKVHLGIIDIPLRHSQTACAGTLPSSWATMGSRLITSYLEIRMSGNALSGGGLQSNFSTCNLRVLEKGGVVARDHKYLVNEKTGWPLLQAWQRSRFASSVSLVLQGASHLNGHALNIWKTCV
jgi:hypothetical protein